jgi:hypothetical protein
VIAFLDERVDGRMLGIARIILGIAVLLKGLLTAAILHNFLQSDAMRFGYGPLDLSTPPGVIATGASLFWVILALFFAIGFGTRISGILLATMILLVIGVDQQMYSNHLYLSATLVALMALANAGARYSIDARIGHHDGLVPRWAVLLIKLQLTSVYFFAAVTKLNDGFLSGRVLERSLEPVFRDQIEQLIPLGILAIAAVLTELFLAGAFWSSRLRLVALVVGFGFHLTNVVIMNSSGRFNFTVFALIMLSMMIVFFTRYPGVQEDQVYGIRNATTPMRKRILPTIVKMF